MASETETQEVKKQILEKRNGEEAIEEKGEDEERVEEMEVDKPDEESDEEKEKVVKKGKSDSPKTPGSRPTRERKTVERYSETLGAIVSATKPLSIEKGRGTELKDIPNVAYKLSKRKPDENLQILHSILYGKKTKANRLKKNIGQFSGYVWIENEEKHRGKVKEKLDKCVREKLLDFCDILNIPVNRSSAKKDELSVKLLDFLESPRSTTDSLLADKKRKSKKLKRKRKTSKSPGSLDKVSGKSAKKQQKSEDGEKHKRSPKIEEEESDDETSNTKDESAEDSDDKEAHEVGSDQEESGSDKGEEEEEEEEEKEENSEKEEEEEEKPKKKKSNGNVSSKKTPKKESGNKATVKPKAVKKDNPAKSPNSSAKSTKVSPGTASKRGASGADSLTKPKKQKVERESQEEENVKENASNEKQSTQSPAKVSVKEGKGKNGKKAKVEPNNEEIHEATVNILKEVDFSTVTLSDIIRKLGSHFGVDLMHKKAEVKAIITAFVKDNEKKGDDPETEDVEEKNEGEEEEEKEENSEKDDEEEEEENEENSEKDDEEEEEEEEEKPKEKKSKGNISSKKITKKDCGSKTTEKPKAVRKENPAKSPKSSTKSPKVSPGTASKRSASNAADSRAKPKKQKVEKQSQKEENEVLKETDSNKKQSTKSPAKVSEMEGKSGKKAKVEPNNEEIHEAAVTILKEVDFNSVSVSDIIKKLGNHFGVDLMHKKAEVKAIITDFIENNMSDEEEGEDDPEAAEDVEEKNEGDDSDA